MLNAPHSRVKTSMQFKFFAAMTGRKKSNFSGHVIKTFPTQVKEEEEEARAAAAPTQKHARITTPSGNLSTNFFQPPKCIWNLEQKFKLLTFFRLQQSHKFHLCIFKVR